MVPDVTIKFTRTVAVVTALILQQNILLLPKKACSPNTTLRLITQMLHPGI